MNNKTEGIVIRRNGAGNYTVSTEDGTVLVNVGNAFEAGQKAAAMLLALGRKESEHKRLENKAQLEP